MDIITNLFDIVNKLCYNINNSSSKKVLITKVYLQTNPYASMF